MNSYGILHNYNQVPLYTPDFSLISNVLQYKQGNLDTNRQRLQSVIDNFEELDVYKDVDRDYLENRIDLITQVTNKYANADLSDPGLLNVVQRNLNQIVDDNVKNAVMSTRVFRAEQKEWDEKRTKEPEKYSEINHAYSMRASEGWRNSQEVGARYKGGGGFKEYINVEKLVSDKLPQIADKMQWTYQVDGEGNGVFRTKDTYETIPRAKVEAALEGLLDPKAREQLKINAWGLYSQSSDEAIRSTYEGTVSKKITTNQDKLDKYKSLRAASSDPDKIQEYDELIKGFEAEIGILKTSSYDKVGKEGAYTSLYTNQFKENYLNAYSYESRFVKSEVNDLDVATRNYELAVHNSARADKQLALNEKKYELDLAKAQAKSKGVKLGPNGEILPADETPDKKKTDPSIYKETEQEGASAMIARKQEESIKGMANVLSGQGITENDLSDPGLVAELKKGSAGRDKVKVKLSNGREVTLDFTNKYVSKAVDEFNTNVLRDSGAKKAYYKTVDNLVQKSQFKIGTVLSKGGDIDPNSLPNYQEKLVVDGKGGFKVEKVNKAAGNYYANLIRASKERKLTESEKATLDWYSHRHLLADPEISKSDRQLIYSKIDKDFRQKTSSGRDMMSSNWYEEYKITAQDSEAGTTQIPVTSMTTDNLNLLFKKGLDLQGKNLTDQLPDGLGDLVALASEAKSGNKEADKKLQWAIKNYNRKVGVRTQRERVPFTGYENPISSSDYYLSDFNRADLEWSDSAMDWDKTFNTGLQADIRTSIDKVKLSIDKEYEALNLNPSKVTHVFSEEKTPEMLSALKRQLGISDDKIGVIDLIPVLDPATGAPKGTYLASYKKKDSKTGYFVAKPLGSLTDEQLKEAGVNMGSGKRSDYNAIYGDYAPTVDLGDASVKALRDSDASNGSSRFRRLRETSQTVFGTDLPFMVKNDVINYAANISPDLARTVDSLYSGAEKGAYTFKLESDGTQWNHSIFMNGERVFSTPLNTQELSDEEVEEMKMNSQLYNQRTFSEFVAEEIEVFVNTQSLKTYE